MTETVKTSSLIFELENTDFSKLIALYDIRVYEIPPSIIAQVGKAAYGLFHRLIKDLCGDHPYYLHKPVRKIYVLYKKNDPSQIEFEGQNLEYALFTHYSVKDTAHCWLNTLLAHYFHSKGKINNNCFYLLWDDFTSKKGYAYINVLSISINHNYKNTKRFELFVNDAATRMRAISPQAYLDPNNKGIYNSKMPYIPKYSNTDGKIEAVGQIGNKALLQRKEVIYIQDTDLKNKTKMSYHSIESADKYEKSRCAQLHQFLTDWMTYLQALDIKVMQKELKMKAQQNEDKPALIDFRQFSITLIDATLGKLKGDKSLITYMKDNIRSISKLKNESISTAVINERNPEDMLKNDTHYLLLMDYEKDNFDIGDEYAPLTSGYEDLYKTWKTKLSHAVSQAFCINENAAKAQKMKQEAAQSHSDENRRKWRPTDFLSYKGLSNDAFRLRYEVCVQQLYLKSLVQNRVSAAKFLPLYESVKNKIFVTQARDKKNNLYRKMVYIDIKDVLVVEEWTDETLKEIIKTIVGKDVDIFSIRKNYHIFPPPESFEMLISVGSVIEIEEISERMMYDEDKVKGNFDSRKVKFPIERWTEWKYAAGKFSERQVKQFNDFILQEVEEIDGLSFDDLREKDVYWDRIKEILNLVKEDVLIKSLLNPTYKMNIKTKKAKGIFKLYQGIWYDSTAYQYFVGAKKGNSYEHNQEKGNQMRRIAVLEGKFIPNDYFALLDVEFIRYGGYTVVPYPFALIKMAD